MCYWLFFFQAEDGIRGLVRSRGLGDVYKRQALKPRIPAILNDISFESTEWYEPSYSSTSKSTSGCLLYTSDAADERSSVDLGGRRIIKKKTS